jgi:hypothetical protein
VTILFRSFSITVDFIETKLVNVTNCISVSNLLGDCRCLETEIISSTSTRARFFGPSQTSREVHPASCRRGTGSLYQGVKRPERHAGNPPPSSVDVSERVELYLCVLCVPTRHVTGHLYLYRNHRLNSVFQRVPPPSPLHPITCSTTTSTIAFLMFTS